jgi:phenylacetate-CoA ligase
MLPYIRRKLIEPLWELKTKSPLVSYWKKLEDSQYLPEDFLRQKQWVKLKEMINYVYHHNKYYKYLFDRVGVAPDDIQGPDDIIKLPVITKDDIRTNCDDLISDGYEKTQLQRSKTGGSTGTSLEIFKTEECSELKNACARRIDRWSGWEPGEPIGAVWGNPPYLTSFKARLREWLLSPRIFLDTMNLNERSVVQFAKEWQKVKPTLLYGHSHSLYLLATYVKNLKINEIVPKAIISTSMMLMPHERKFMESVFGVKVFDRYGCEEVSLIAAECERHEGMHINIEHLFVEFIKSDGNYAKPGEEGEIVVTDLLNRAMPLIRYRVEDVGVPSEKRCSCGRGLPVMERVVGRVADFLVRKDGGLVAGVSLIERTLTAISGIRQMQIVQESINKIVINIVKEPSFSENSEKELIYELNKVLGNSVNIRLVFVDKISQERSGKYRFSISHVKPFYCSVD